MKFQKPITNPFCEIKKVAKVSQCQKTGTLWTEKKTLKQR